MAVLQRCMSMQVKAGVRLWGVVKVPQGKWQAEGCDWWPSDMQADYKEAQAWALGSSHPPASGHSRKWFRVTPIRHYAKFDVFWACVFKATAASKQKGRAL